MLQKVLIFIQSVLRQLVGKKSVSTTTTVPLMKPGEPVPNLLNVPLVLKEQLVKIEIPVEVNLPPVPEVFDAATEAKLKELYPPFAAIVREFLKEAHKQGMPVGLFCGYRSFVEQRALYSQGRDAKGDIIDHHKVVTNALPGKSWHQFGLAIDLVFDGNPTKPGWQWDWDHKYPWKKLADLGKTFGLEPAYYWTHFPECPHFQKVYGMTLIDVLALYNKGGLPRVWGAIDLKKTT